MSQRKLAIVTGASSGIGSVTAVQHRAQAEPGSGE
jgi:NADP-dependent 3-hydroxy acid dehydrogenase YdfG